MTQIIIPRSTMQRVESKIVATSTEELKKIMLERDPESAGGKLITQVLKDREEAASVDPDKQK